MENKRRGGSEESRGEGDGGQDGEHCEQSMWDEGEDTQCVWGVKCRGDEEEIQGGDSEAGRWVYNEQNGGREWRGKGKWRGELGDGV